VRAKHALDVVAVVVVEHRRVDVVDEDVRHYFVNALLNRDSSP
jgi:hypothetical protein